ncbi:hypothetical protein M0R45_006165 [Rubus argutus]|uniref:Uncharacterized protein n=1 Tax=Rubus argutus TaxID=59490 RepID=A0AAW1YPS6_RUBAR
MSKLSELPNTPTWPGPISLDWRSRACRSAEDVGLLELEIAELLLAVHLDDERDDEDEDGGSEDPGSLAGALEQLLGNKCSVGGGLLAVGNDLGLGDPGDDAIVVLLKVLPLHEGDSAFPSLACHHRRVGECVDVTLSQVGGHSSADH